MLINLSTRYEGSTIVNKSESITKLATALAKVQAEMTAAPLNAKNPFLKNEYADLGSIINTAKPVIAKHGISVSQFPISNGNTVGIETILMHESGEWMSNELNLELTSEKGKSAAQVAGSIISYLRRYSYASVLGMYSGDDNDGHSEPEPTPKAQPHKVFDTVQNSNGEFYKDLPKKNLSFMVRALEKNIAEIGEPNDDTLPEYEQLTLKLEAARYYLK